jgi:hypothetical protein
MNSTLEEMLNMFEQFDQTVIEIDDFDTNDPTTEINVIVSNRGTAMIIRIGWGSLGLHADIYGYREGQQIETQSVQLDLTSAVYVRDKT